LSAFSEHGHKLRFFRTHFRNTNTNDKSGDFFGHIFGPSIFTVLLSAFSGHRHNLQIWRFFRLHFWTINIHCTIVHIFRAQTQLTNPEIFLAEFLDHQYSQYYYPHFWGTDTIYKSGDLFGRIFGAQTQFINPEIFSDAKIPLSHWANLCSINFLTVIVHLAQ
jgi:hypothetical protein